ncbi:MAG: radical SAM protein [bacterium]|nr:radical SAM protein [bacterium]
MDKIEKLKILSEDSQYDLACACGTGKNDRRRRGNDGKWIYPVTLPNGGYSLLLKTLLSNVCSNDCKYCPLRNNSNIKRCSLTPDEVAEIFMNYYRKKKVFGLFLSSGVIDNPDYTMDKIISVASILRKKYLFKGYIHLKVIPGISDAALEEVMSFASAVSLNIETPGKRYFKELSKKKNFEDDIIRPIKLMSNLVNDKRKFSKVKLTTQFIVGAAKEPDSDILKYSSALYDRLNFNRVYFSAYQSGLGKTRDNSDLSFTLSNDLNYSFTREHRLYQADFLMRQYGFNEKELYYNNSGNLSLDKDPKEVWAELNPSFYPININNADMESLLRVPGLGPLSVKKIIKLRKLHKILDLNDIGIKGKRYTKINSYIKFS